MIVDVLRTRAAVGTVLFAACVTGSAARAETAPPLVVNADRSTAVNVPNSGQSQVTYEGRVVLTRGSTEIDGGRAVVFLQHENLDKATVTGSPATFTWRPKTGQIVHGTAQQITYLVRQDEVVLTGNVEVRRGSETFSAAEAHYFLQTGTLTAHGGTSATPGRVHVVMPPPATHGKGGAGR
jgi:lipopolysaccharide export system protein LptA